MPPPPATQPPPPCISPPTTTTTNHNTTYRSARAEELEALRQKGLAKIFNKHFTTVAEKIRQEREAAELALAEIIKRKSELAENPKSFKEGGLTLTQLEKLYMELKKRKNDVQRKERETQELYKRYCSQYGDELHLHGYHPGGGGSGQKLQTVQEGMGMGMHPYRTNGTYTHADMIRQADLALAKAKEDGYRQDLIDNHDHQHVQNNISAFTEHGYNTMPTPESNVDHHHVYGISAADHPHWSNDNDNDTDRDVPRSPGELSKQFPTPRKETGTGTESIRSPDVVAPSAKITPQKMTYIPQDGGHDEKDPAAMDVEKPQPYQIPNPHTPLEATAASTPTSTNISPGMTPSANNKTNIHHKQHHLNTTHSDNVSVMDRSLYFHPNLMGDDDSAVSGLTDIDCATVAEAEWKLTEFLRTETENIKKMLLHEPDMNEEEDDEYGAGAGGADNYSIYTYNRSLVSGESDRVARAAREAEEMVQRMAEATAWMNDPTLLEQDSDVESSGEESDGDETQKQKQKHNSEDLLEWVAFWSGDHDRVYYHNRTTNQTCWTKPKGVEIDMRNVQGKEIDGETVVAARTVTDAGNQAFRSDRSVSASVSVSVASKKSKGSKSKSKSNQKKTSSSKSKSSKSSSSKTVTTASTRSNRSDSDTSRTSGTPIRNSKSRSISNAVSPPNSDEKVDVKDFTKTSSSAGAASGRPSADAISVSNYTNDHMIKTFRPDTTAAAAGSNQSVDESHNGSNSIASATKSSKVMQYRRKRAQQARKKRRMIVASVLCVVFGSALLFKKEEMVQFLSGGGSNSNKLEQAGSSSGTTNSSLTPEEQKRQEAEKKLKLAKKLAAMEAERKRVAERKRLEAEKAAEAERKLALAKQQAELEAAKKKLAEMEEAKLKKELEEKEKMEEEKRKKVQEAALQLAIVEAAKEEEERVRSLQVVEDEMRRPWACNIPFTYIMSRKCWRVAKSNPIYDCEGITDYMME